ncbi:MAG: GxxExxY protein [Blastocatellia bacterium]|nr:GxxExxY protein [Blastocatellia bacterium]
MALEDRTTELIIGCAYQVHKKLGAGFLEKVYENALRIETEKSGLRVRQQAPINVLYDGNVVGEYFADLLVDDKVIVELKAVQALTKEHEQQVVHYLNATGFEIGLLINFGSSVQVKRKHRLYKPSGQS